MRKHPNNVVSMVLSNRSLAILFVLACVVYMYDYKSQQRSMTSQEICNLLLACGTDTACSKALISEFIEKNIPADSINQGLYKVIDKSNKVQAETEKKILEISKILSTWGGRPILDSLVEASHGLKNIVNTPSLLLEEISAKVAQLPRGESNEILHNIDIPEDVILLAQAFIVQFFEELGLHDDIDDRTVLNNLIALLKKKRTYSDTQITDYHDVFNNLTGNCNEISTVFFVIFYEFKKAGRFKGIDVFVVYGNLYYSPPSSIPLFNMKPRGELSNHARNFVVINGNHKSSFAFDLLNAQ